MSSPFRLSRRVEFRDTDAAGIAHFSVFFNYMEQAEHALWRDLGLSVQSGEPAVSWPRVAAKCDYKSSVRFEDVVDIDVSVERVGEKSVTFACLISHEGREVAVGKLVAVCCRFSPDASPEPIPIPPAIRQKLLARQ